AKPADTAHGCPALLNSEKAAVCGTASHPPILGAPSSIIARQRIGWRLRQHYGRNKERSHNIRREAHRKASLVVTLTYTCRPMFIPGIGLWSNSRLFSGTTIRRCAKQQRPFLAIIVFEAQAISGRRLRQGSSQSNSGHNWQRRATPHAVYQERQNSLHTLL